jgi:hypothetical protein
VHPGPDGAARRPERAHDRSRAADRACRAVERRQQLVPRPEDGTPAEPSQLGTDDLVVLAEVGGPGAGGRLQGQQRRKHAVGLDGLAELREKPLDLVEQGFGVAFPRQVDVAGKLDHARARDALAHEARPVAPAFVCAMEHERGDADRRQQLADVDLGVHEPQRLCRAGACAAPHVRRVPLERFRVARDAWGDPSEPVSRRRRGPIVLVEEGKALPQILVAHSPRVVRGPHLACEGAQEDERGGSRGVCRGKERRQRPALGDAEQGRPLRPGRVQDCADVVHASLQIRQAVGRDAIGEAGPALVEEDEPPQRGKPAVEGREPRIFPAGLEGADPAVDEHEVDRPVAHDLVRDPDVVASGVPDVAQQARARAVALRPARGRRLERGVLSKDPPLEVA